MTRFITWKILSCSRNTMFGHIECLVSEESFTTAGLSLNPSLREQHFLKRSYSIIVNNVVPSDLYAFQRCNVSPTGVHKTLDFQNYYCCGVLRYDERRLYYNWCIRLCSTERHQLETSERQRWKRFTITVHWWRLNFNINNCSYLNLKRST